MSELVQRLCEGEHPVEASVRPARTVQGFKACIDRGYVHVRFTATRGGTELGFSLDRERSDLSHADFDRETGRLLVVGPLTLDYAKVRCIADLELPSLEGVGRLEPESA